MNQQLARDSSECISCLRPNFARCSIFMVMLLLALNIYAAELREPLHTVGPSADFRTQREHEVVADYVAQIKTKITENLSFPKGSVGRSDAEYKVLVLPTGEVLTATLVKSSGSPAIDAAVESAILKSAPLPLPSIPSLFKYFRELRLSFPSATVLRRV